MKLWQSFLVALIFCGIAVFVLWVIGYVIVAISEDILAMPKHERDLLFGGGLAFLALALFVTLIFRIMEARDSRKRGEYERIKSILTEAGMSERQAREKASEMSGHRETEYY